MQITKQILLKEKNSMEKSQRVEWLNLPTELWTMIAKHLILDNTSFEEVFRFRSICKTWRSAHPLPQHTPFAPQVRIRLRRHGKSVLLQTTMYRLQPLLNDDDAPSKGWLIMLGKSESAPLRLLNPFTCTRVSDTPQASEDTLPRVVNFMNFKVVKLLEAFDCNAISVLKLVLFPSTLPVEGRMVGALFNGGGNNLWVRKIGDKIWTNIRWSDYKEFHDIIIHKGQLYVIDCLGTIFWMNPLSTELVPFTQPLFSLYKRKTKKMVEFRGRLYVVAMLINTNRSSWKLEADIKVYTVNEEWCRWEVVKSLGDVAFVLGKHSNFSLSAQDYHGIEGNCIYFSDSPDIFKVYRFSLKDSTLTISKPFWPCPDLFNKT